ncbi:Hypothetical predicted protein [Paramuricea clavata]|uniref:Chorein N-terminal domain-containing protein n=2 Tax=Paramuricea clavata TaxID=317549 RepID=A0A7D9HCW8_PARCT|nr:Hypothetical predicted protein [Paramuricea clavata]
MHIVKNIQVFVSNIHIRYEDTLSNEDGPFSVGITLENLSAESVDDNWQPVVVDSKQSLVNKLVRLDNLALYLNSHDKIGELPTPADWVNIAKAGIAKGEFGGNVPESYSYVIEPLTLETKAILDTNTVPNLSIPKVFVEIIMKELGLVLSRHQFKDIMRLADNFDRMQTNSQFRKYKPFVCVAGNGRAWWNYAIRAVLEEDVKRQSRNWSWQHIVNHRMNCHKYLLLYKEKLSHKSVSDKVQKEIDHYEEILDVLNITIWRKQAEIETKKEGTNYILNQQRKKDEGGWFSGFFGKKKSKDSKAVTGLTKEEEAAEEQKLYAAIGYSESEAPVKLPAEYVAYKLKFAQKRISVKLRDDTIEPACCVSSVSLEELFVELGYRPGAQAVSVLTKLGNFTVLGCPVENQSAPEVVRSVAGETDIAEYVNASFETNPLDGKCDQRIKLTVQPLEVIYHANTIENLMNFFTLPEDVHLSEISAAAYSQIDGLRNQSRTNLSYAIETRTVL